MTPCGRCCLISLLMAAIIAVAKRENVPGASSEKTTSGTVSVFTLGNEVARGGIGAIALYSNVEGLYTTEDMDSG